MTRPIPDYAEPVAATNFSFLRGASPGAQMVLAAILLGHTGLGIADRNTVAGVVRAFQGLRDLHDGSGLPPVKVRAGSGPGEYHYLQQEGPEEADARLRAMVQERAQGFRLITGTRIAFADGTPDIVPLPGKPGGVGADLPTAHQRQSARGEGAMPPDAIGHCGRSA